MTTPIISKSTAQHLSVAATMLERALDNWDKITRSQKKELKALTHLTPDETIEKALQEITKLTLLQEPLPGMEETPKEKTKK